VQTLAVLLKKPQQIALSRLDLVEPGEADLVVDVAFSGISTGTEKLLYTGRMPHFPGMGYPLVPGYESVGQVAAAGPLAGFQPGAFVFVPGARCFGPLEGEPVHGLFGGAARRLVVPGRRAHSLPASLADEHHADQAVLLALAATAHHAVTLGRAPQLVVGHGVLGRLIARIAIALGHEAPVVWEREPLRAAGGEGYAVLDPEQDPRRDYAAIMDVSGDEAILDVLVARLAPRGEITLAGFYSQRLSFAFPPAFMREASIRIAAEWQPADIDAVRTLIEAGQLSLDGLITHRSEAGNAEAAYRTAFGDAACLKMVLDWRGIA
jgi:3-hydroxyethyl bacteriochlorophyllide a dehydrogenase